MIKHLLFDNDGTLVDSEIICVRVMLQQLRRYGLDMTEREYSMHFPGLLERDIIQLVKTKHGLVLPDDFQEQLRDAFRGQFDTDLRAIPGMPGIFKKLRVPKSIVSNASTRHVRFSLKKVRIHHALDGHIFSAEHVDRPKPYPDVYHLALNKLELQAGDVLVVEDSPTGVTAAKQAGMRVVGFLGAAHIHDGHEQLLLECGADFIAPNAKALAGILEKFRLL